MSIQIHNVVDVNKTPITAVSVRARRWFQHSYGNTYHSVEVRFYRTAARNYVCVWIHTSELGLWGQQGGMAGGYGYNREEAALNQAIRKFNIKTPDFMDCRDFMEAFAKYLGYKVFEVVETHA